MRKRTPAGLGPAGSQLWRGVCRDYELSVPELAVLERACRTMDLLAACENARASIVLARMPVIGPNVATADEILRITIEGLTAVMRKAKGETGCKP